MNTVCAVVGQHAYLLHHEYDYMYSKHACGTAGGMLITFQCKQTSIATAPVFNAIAILYSLSPLHACMNNQCRPRCYVKSPTASIGCVLANTRPHQLHAIYQKIYV